MKKKLLADCPCAQLLQPRPRKNVPECVAQWVCHNMLSYLMFRTQAIRAFFERWATSYCPHPERFIEIPTKEVADINHRQVLLSLVRKNGRVFTLSTNQCISKVLRSSLYREKLLVALSILHLNKVSSAFRSIRRWNSHIALRQKRVKRANSLCLQVLHNSKIAVCKQKQAFLALKSLRTQRNPCIHPPTTRNCVSTIQDWAKKLAVAQVYAIAGAVYAMARWKFQCNRALLICTKLFKVRLQSSFFRFQTTLNTVQLVKSTTPFRLKRFCKQLLQHSQSAFHCIRFCKPGEHWRAERDRERSQMRAEDEAAHCFASAARLATLTTVMSGLEEWLQTQHSSLQQALLVEPPVNQLSPVFLQFSTNLAENNCQVQADIKAQHNALASAISHRDSLLDKTQKIKKTRELRLANQQLENKITQLLQETSHIKALLAQKQALAVSSILKRPLYIDRSQRTLPSQEDPSLGFQS